MALPPFLGLPWEERRTTAYGAAYRIDEAVRNMESSIDKLADAYGEILSVIERGRITEEDVSKLDEAMKEIDEIIERVKRVKDFLVGVSEDILEEEKGE